MKNNSGLMAFTLIELLIVVAIIAVLAAIAVPNFLEAQTRSKVSRIKSDMRTVGMAMEQYVIDNNKYFSTEDAAYTKPNQRTGDPSWWFLYMKMLNTRVVGGRFSTTPIAYLTSFPISPFMTTMMLRTAKQWGGSVEEFSFMYMAGGMDPRTGIRKPTPFSLNYPKISYPDVGFVLLDCGPNLDITSNDKFSLYDPTNGTVSLGDIFWLGKSFGGIGFGGR